MVLSPLCWEERLATGCTHKARVTYADLTTVNAVHVQAIYPDSGNCAVPMIVGRVMTRLVTAFDFSDAGITSLTMSIGDGGGATRFISAQQLAADGTPVYSAATNTAYVYTAADTIDATFTASGGATPLCSEATSGVVDVYLQLMNLPA